MLSTRSLVALCLPLLARAADPEIGDGYIRHQISAIEAPAANATTLLRRQDEVPSTSQLTGTLYTVQLNLGTPSQPVVVIVDTGSSELWVNPQCANAGDPTSVAFCKTLPVFNTKTSQSLVDLHVAGSIQYGKGDVSLEYYTDFVSVGCKYIHYVVLWRHVTDPYSSLLAAKIAKQIFGVATSSNDIDVGIMGLGPALSAGDAYPFVLDNLATQKLINSRAFSLDLRSIDSAVGSVIFGGIDTGKYIGNLEKIPIVDLRATEGDRYV